MRGARCAVDRCWGVVSITICSCARVTPRSDTGRGPLTVETIWPVAVLIASLLFILPIFVIADFANYRAGRSRAVHARSARRPDVMAPGHVLKPFANRYLAASPSSAATMSFSWFARECPPLAD